MPRRKLPKFRRIPQNFLPVEYPEDSREKMQSLTGDQGTMQEQRGTAGIYRESSTPKWQKRKKMVFPFSSKQAYLPLDEPFSILFINLSFSWIDENAFRLDQWLLSEINNQNTKVNGYQIYTRLAEIIWANKVAIWVEMRVPKKNMSLRFGHISEVETLGQLAISLLEVPVTSGI